MSSGNDLLTVGEAADFLRLRPSTIRSWLLKRQITFVKLSRRVFLRRGDLEELLERSVIPAKEPGHDS